MPQPRPLTPTELREATVRDYTRSLARLGGMIDRAAIERLALADLELVDAARRAGEISRGPEAGSPFRAAPYAPAGASLRVREDGSTEKREPGKVVLVREMDARARRIDERWALATGRVARIIEGAGGSSSYAAAAANAAFPKLAKEWADTLGDWLTRDAMPGSTFYRANNRFLGLSDRDAGRKLRRIVEDICDRSSGILGPWAVPK